MRSSPAVSAETSVAWWTPLPPQRSGIADYSYAVLEQMAQRLHITAVVEDRAVAGARAPEGVAVIGASRAACSPFDLDVYHFGNHWAYHGFMFEQALRRPGMLVLHDPSLYDFYRGLTGGSELSPVLAEELAYDSKGRYDTTRLPSVDVCEGTTAVDRLQVLMSRRLTEASRLTLVHSQWAAEVLRRRYGADVVRIGFMTGGRTGQRGRPHGGGAPRAVRFGTFGGLGRHKRAVEVVQALVDLLDTGADARLTIAGHNDDPAVLDEIEQLLKTSPEASERLHLELSPPLQRLHELMAGCDVVISLRWPTAGETSATLAAALAMGKPVVISDVPQLRELPDSLCWRIPVDRGLERRRLRDTLAALASDPALVEQSSAAAERYADRELDPDVVAGQYLDAVERCLRADPSAGTGRTRVASAVRDRTIAVRPTLGINAIGSWASCTGLAEAARRSLLATMRHGVAAALTDCDIGTPTDPRRLPEELRRLPGGRPFAVDVCYLNLNEIGNLPSTLLKDRRDGRVLAAGCWFWESTVLPAELRLCVERFAFDAVVVGSRFVRDCLTSYLRCPVHVVPVVVEPRPDPSVTRSDFGLDERSTVFLHSFDAFSGLRRKNPFGVIDAFEQAFGSASRRDVSLVLKSSNLRRLPEAHARITARLARTGGVLIDDELSGGEMAALIGLSDVYVSLHRSEGFGLGPAEAMALGKPVVATGYSGTNDFVTHETGLRVGYRLVPITPGELFLNPGLTTARMLLGDRAGSSAVWAEPDLSDAARWMVWAHDHPEQRSSLGRRGQEVMRQRFSSAAVGASMGELVSRWTGMASLSR
jgi:glycosyltransferase involved in cell wall biosynthesis